MYGHYAQILDVEQEAIAAAKVCQEQRHGLRGCLSFENSTDANFRRLLKAGIEKTPKSKLLTSEAWTRLPLPQFVGMAS